MDAVYIETSIVSHATAWPSPDPATAVLQDQAKRWMDEQRLLYDIVTSQLVIDEAVAWLDEVDLCPGRQWQQQLEEQIDNIKSAAVIVGKAGIGPWQDQDINAFIREFVSRKCPVIPVILEPCKKVPQMPIFLRGFIWVDFRKNEPDPLKQLIWGITGDKGNGG